MAALCESFLSSLRNATHNSAVHGFVALVYDGRIGRSMVARVFEKFMSRITCIEAILLRETERDRDRETVRERVHELARVCFDRVWVLCFVMGYVLQSGEIART